MRIAIGSDHAGFVLKTHLVELLRGDGHEVDDLGTHSPDPVDYPPICAAVARAVVSGRADRGIVLGGSGQGEQIAANKVRGIRAALCNDLYTARLSREHNDANVLALGGRVVAPGLADEIVRLWLSTPFHGGRHQRRLDQITTIEESQLMSDTTTAAVDRPLAEADPEIAEAIADELERQRTNLMLIASENLTPPAVLEAQGSVLTNKYAEGYPGRRYYGGCEFVDVAESLAIERAKALFGAEHANVQPHSGAQANMAAYVALGVEHGDTIMAMSLAHGGHLTHGSPVNFSGKWYDVAAYGVRRSDELLDMDEVRAIARERRPKVIVAGYTAYPRQIDFAAFREICDEVGAKLMVDCAHFVGLIAGGVHPNPVPYADVVTFTTHKTLRGPRGGAILSTAEHAKAVDKAVFPMLQGGPQMHSIAAKAVAFKLAAEPAFKQYAQQVVANARALAEALVGEGLRMVSGGTDIHYLLADLTALDLTGAEAEKRCDAAGISLNKNAIPYDPNPPMVASGIRVGVPSVTTQGMGTAEMTEIARLIGRVLKSESEVPAVRADVAELCRRFPAYPTLPSGSAA
ncbi:MAG TPA: ribose 5-phosphate isomerase B [Egibacteraceae bacterium]